MDTRSLLLPYLHLLVPTVALKVSNPAVGFHRVAGTTVVSYL